MHPNSRHTGALLAQLEAYTIVEEGHTKPPHFDEVMARLSEFSDCYSYATCCRKAKWFTG
jgi:hypothetical protein